MDDRRRSIQVHTRYGGTQGADIQLTLHAQIEQAALHAKIHSKAAEDQRRRLQYRLQKSLL